MNKNCLLVMHIDEDSNLPVADYASGITLQVDSGRVILDNEFDGPWAIKLENFISAVKT